MDLSFLISYFDVADRQTKAWKDLPVKVTLNVYLIAAGGAEFGV